MKFKSVIFTLLAILVASCTLEPIPEPVVEQEENIVTTNVAISPETRVTYTGGTGNNVLSWEGGDKLLLAGYNGTTFIRSEVFTNIGGNKFSGTPVAGADNYTAYYPGDVITLDANGNVNPFGVNFWQQTQNGDGTTGHLKNKLLLFDETPNAIGDGFALNLKSSILKLTLSGIPAAVGTLNKLIYTVETASGVFKSVDLNVTNVTFSSDKTDLTAYIAFDPTVVTGIIAGGTVTITLSGAKSYKWSTQAANVKTYTAGKCYLGIVTTGWAIEINNPLSYFAEHNMANLTGTFETGHDATGQYLFYWNDAMTAYNTTPATLDGKSYYLPTILEWRAIIPESNTYINFNGWKANTLSNAAVTVGGESYTMSGTFEHVSGVVYATLTYTHQSYPTLYAIARYRKENQGAGNPDSRMVIDMKSTATQYTLQQSKDADWSSVGVVSRVFPAAGYSTALTPIHQGQYGYHWSSTVDSGSNVWNMLYDNNAAYSASFTTTDRKHTIRLVSR
jgi:hypothetical protein